MRCEQCRQALSARLDGEPEQFDTHRVDTHLAGCARCQGWFDDAATVNRLARMSLVTAPAGVSDSVLDALPGRGRRRVAAGLRTALGALSFAQFTLGMAQLTILAPGEHPHLAAVASGSTHLWHESASWNVALGAGFGWIALRRTRPAGLIPLLTAFVAILTLVSANDLFSGRVDTTRLLSHAMILAGYAIIVALTRPAFDVGPPPQGSTGPGRWSVQWDPADSPGAGVTGAVARSVLPRVAHHQPRPHSARGRAA